MSLQYLFTAYFKDGSTIKQTIEDVSTINPEKSAFYDVLQRIEDLSHFVLHDHKTIPNDVSVCLVDGSFNVNGLALNVGDPRIQPPQDTEYRLIYFRRHTHRFNPQLEELDHEVEYVIGWQATIDGKNIQQTIIVR